MGIAIIISEKLIERKLREATENRGGKCLKWVSPGNNGVPDRITLMPDGRIWFVELKSDGKGLDPLQVYWFKVLRSMGFECILINSQKTLDEFIQTL